MPADVADDLGPVGQESNVAGILDRRELGARDSAGQRSLACCRDNHVVGAGQDQGRHLDSPESIGNVE